MTDNTELDYESEHKRLDELERQQLGHDKIMQRISVAAARYQLDQAVSLAILADGIERLVAQLTGAVPEEGSVETREPDEQVWTLATEAEVGDHVAQRTESGAPNRFPPAGIAVAEVGTSEGDVWLRLEGSGAKRWAKDFVIVEGAEDADEELADRVEVEGDFSSPQTDEDDDFAAPVPADGFAALKSGKGKKGGK